MLWIMITDFEPPEVSAERMCAVEDEENENQVAGTMHEVGGVAAAHILPYGIVCSYDFIPPELERAIETGSETVLEMTKNQVKPITELIKVRIAS